MFTGLLPIGLIYLILVITVIWYTINKCDRGGCLWMRPVKIALSDSLREHNRQTGEGGN